MTLMNEHILSEKITELEDTIKTQKKTITELEGIIVKFKKTFDNWRRFKTQLGITDE